MTFEKRPILFRQRDALYYPAWVSECVDIDDRRGVVRVLICWLVSRLVRLAVAVCLPEGCLAACPFTPFFAYTTTYTTTYSVSTYNFHPPPQTHNRRQVEWLPAVMLNIPILVVDVMLYGSIIYLMIG